MGILDACLSSMPCGGAADGFIEGNELLQAKLLARSQGRRNVLQRRCAWNGLFGNVDWESGVEGSGHLAGEFCDADGMLGADVQRQQRGQTEKHGPEPDG